MPVVALVAALAFVTPAAAAPARNEARPRLAVLVVFDQLRALELDRYAPFFGAGGFGGLDGARFDAFYAYAGAETGPGHATLATGTNPNVHGIGTNHWLVDGARLYCVDDPAFPVLGATDKSGRSARFLRVPTLGDTMKADSGGKAKVVALSEKDRAAILTAGPSADLALWYDNAQARYTTSTAYADALPPWLADKGASIPAATLAHATWSPLPVPKGLEWLVPVDDRPGEGAAEGFGRTFPHDLAPLPDALKRKLYRIVPQSIDDLFTLALVAVDEVGLGKDDEPDLLIVSVSTTDIVGHNYGPDSLEQLDTLRRADVSLRAFIRGLEARVGKSYVLALTSDHGAPPLPAPAEGARWPHGILSSDDVAEAADRAVRALLPADKKKRVLGFWSPQIGLDVADLAPPARAAVFAAIITAVEAVPGVARVYDLSAPSDVDPFEPLMRESYVPGRQSPLAVRPAPRVVILENKDKLGTDHGAPYGYDRRVPVIFTGPGVKRGRYAQPIDPRDIAPTLAFLLGVAPPDAAQGKPVEAVGE